MKKFITILGLFFVLIPLTKQGALNAQCFDSDSGVIELSSLDGTNGFTLYGANANDETGESMSNAGDIKMTE